MSFTIKQLGLVRAFARRLGAAQPERRSGERPSLRLVQLEDRSVPANFVVTNGADSGTGSLRAAIIAANGSLEADTITFSGVTTVTLTSGELLLTDTFPTTIDGGASGVTVTRSTAVSNFRVFNIDNNARATLTKLTISNGKTSGTGGGINVQADAFLTIHESTVTNNVSTSASGGGGVYVSLGQLRLINSTITGNTATAGDGGGIGGSTNNTIMISGSTVSGNTSTDDGGGLYLNSAFAISNSTVSGNTAGRNGGGIWLSASASQNAEVANVLVASNSAGIDGGGVHNNGTLRLTNTTLSNNKSVGNGGGLHAPNSASVMTVINTTIMGNRSDANGGSSGSGGGLNNADISSNSLTLYNSIVAGNFTGSGTVSNNFVNSATTITKSNNFIDGDAKLGPLAANGGKVFTHALLPGSPAIDAGNKNLFPPSITTDQRDAPFARVAGASIDIGAFEVQAVSFASTTLPSGTLGVPYSQALAASFPNQPAGTTYTYTLLSGALPDGLTFTNGAIAGTPTSAGTATFTVRATASTGDFSADTPITLQIDRRPTTAATSDASITFGAGTVSLTATVSSTVTVGEGSVTFRVLDGSAATVGTAVVKAVSNGSATAGYALPTNLAVGTYTIQASYGGSAGFAPSEAPSKTLTVTPGPFARLEVGDGGQSADVGTTFGRPVTVRSTDQFGNPIAGVSVTIEGPTSGPGATFTPTSATTGADGTAKFNAVANNITGTYTVTVRSGAVSQTFTLTNTAGGTATLTVTGGGTQSATVNNQFGAVTVRATDTFGNPVANATVMFTQPASGAFATGVPASLITAADGTATFTPSANTVAGAYTVQAASGAGSAAITLTNTAGALDRIVVQAGGGQTTTVNSTFANPVRLLVTDEFNNPLSGRTIIVTGPVTGAGIAAVTPAATDVGGLTQFTPRANTVAGGPYTVRVSSGGKSGTFTLTNTPGFPAGVTVVSGNNQSAVVTAAFGTAVTVAVVDADGNRIAGQQVAFTIPTAGASATGVPAGLTTDAGGTVTVTPAANGVAGGYVVMATSNGFSTNITLTNTVADGLAVLGGGQSAFVGQAFATPVRVTLTDAGGNPVAGAAVTITGPPTGAGIKAVNPGVTSAAGTFSFTAMANTVAGGPYTVTVQAGGLTRTLELTNVAGQLAQLVVVGGNNQSATVGGGFAPLQFAARDAFDNPLAGVTVDVSALGSGPSAAVPASVTTDTNGTATITATANGKAGGPYAVTVQGGGKSATFTLTNTAGPAAVAVVTGGGQSAMVSDAFGNSIGVRLTDSFGNPVAGVAVTVTGPTAGAGATFSAPAATDAQGNTSFTAAANTAAGGYTVTVAGGTASQTFTLTNTAGPAAAVALVGGGQTATVNEPFAAVQVTVTDAFGNPVPGATVTVSGPGIAPVTPPVTGPDGTASFAPTATTTAGTSTVTVTAGGASGTLTLTGRPGPVAAVRLVGGGGQTATVGAGFAAPVQVTVTDAFGNPVSGAAVTVSGPTAGAGATFSTPSATDAQGRTTFTTTANTTAGGFTATVTAGAVTIVVPFTNAAGPAAAVTVVSGGGQAARVNTAFAAPIVVQVADAFGNPTGPLSVLLTGTGATFGPATATGVPGQAKVAATANASAGEYTVTVTAGAATTTLTLRNTTGPVSPPPPPTDADPLLVGTPGYAVGTGAGTAAAATMYGSDNAVAFSVRPFGDDFTGGARVAAGDVTGDGVPDLIAGTGPGAATTVVVYDGKTQAELFRTAPFEASFTGGVYVAVGDVNGDGKADLIITPDEGGGPRVDVYTAAGFARIASFFGIDDPNFRGGARAAVGDVNGDGTGDLLVSAGFGGGPRIAGFDGRSLTSTPVKLFNDFFAFEQTLRNGVFIAAGDLDGDGKADLIFGGGPGGGPRVLAFGGAGLLNRNNETVLANFFGGDDDSRGGIRVSARDLDGDARADLVVGAGTGAGGRVVGYRGRDIAPAGVPAVALDFEASTGPLGGVFVG